MGYFWAFGLYFYKVFEEIRIIKNLKNAKTSQEFQEITKVSEFLGKPVFIKGKIWTNQPIFSPISQNPCVSFILEKKSRKTRQISEDWYKIQNSQVPFWIQTHFGEFISIDPKISISDELFQENRAVEKVENIPTWLNNLSKSVENLPYSVTGSVPNLREKFLKIEILVNCFGEIGQNQNGYFLKNTSESPAIISNKNLINLPNRKEKIQKSYKNLVINLFLLVSISFFIVATGALGNLLWILNSIFDFIF